MSVAEDPGRTIMRGAQANALGFLLRFGGRLIFLFVAARLYGAHLYGAFILAAAIVELMVAVGGLSTKKTLYPLLDRAAEDGGRPLRHIVFDAALLVASASLALGLLIAAGAMLIAPPELAAALILLAPMVAGQALLDLAIAAARWHGKVRYEVMSRSLIEPWFLALGAIAAYRLGLGEYGLAAAYWCGTIAALGYGLSAVARLYPRPAAHPYGPDRATLRRLAGAAGANTAGDFLNALYTRADLYLAGLLLGPAAAGIYGMARQVATPVRQVWQSFDALLAPAVARTIGRGGAAGVTEGLASASRLMLVIQLPLLIAMLAIGQPLMAWLGPGFEAGFWALVILGAAEVLQSALGVGDLVFVYLKPRIGLYLTAISIAAGTIAALLLIPSLGITGAAFALLTAYALRSVLRFAVLRRRFGMPVPRAHLAGPLAAAAAAAVAVLMVPGPALALAAGLALYAALVALWLKLTGQRLALTGFADQSRAAAN